jgi:hypothetical protein
MAFFTSSSELGVVGFYIFGVAGLLFRMRFFFSFRRLLGIGTSGVIGLDPGLVIGPVLCWKRNTYLLLDL